MTDDLVVVGGGLGGYMAALTAALEEPVASVRLLVPDQDRFRRETGLIDLLGYTPEGTGPVSDPHTALSSLPETHPYSRIDSETFCQALALFAEVSDYCGNASEQNALVGTCTGNLKPTYLYPESVAPGLLSKDEEILLAGFERIADFDAEFAAEKLEAKLPYEIGSTTITLEITDGNEPVTGIARVLDEDRQLKETLTARRAVAGRIRNPLDIEPRIGFPAVLGREETDEIRGALTSLLQADIFEIPLGEPNLLGLRLQSRLESELSDAGVTVETGVTVSGFDASDGRIERLSVRDEDDTQQTREADEFVLATGGLSASGIEASRDQLHEPVFDCHIEQPERRDDWVESGFLEDHPFARLGLQTDEEFRPLASDGQLAFENLRAAGRILGGADFPAEQSGSGVAVVTGYRAGRLAVQL